MSLSKTLKSRFLSRVDRLIGTGAAAVAAASGAGFVGEAPQADAAVISSGAINLNIPSTTDGLYLNVVTGASATVAPFPAGWDVNPYGSSGLLFFSPSTPSGGVYVQRTGGGATANLPTGTVIDGTSVYGSSSASTTGNQPFVLNATNCVGFRLTNDATGAVNYGWMQIAVAGALNGQPRAIVAYAYDDAGLGVQCGVVPEPTSLGMLALGAVGLMARRRRS